VHGIVVFLNGKKTLKLRFRATLQSYGLRTHFFGERSGGFDITVV
jgi:hypothetical protein